MVETIRPKSTWTRVSSTAPVKKIRRRSRQQEEKQFQKHLADKDSSPDREESSESDPNTKETAAVRDKENTESGSSSKPGKRIDIVI